MPTPALSEFESEFARLSPEAQLSLLEHLVHRTRVAVCSGNSVPSMVENPPLSGGISAMRRRDLTLQNISDIVFMASAQSSRRCDACGSFPALAWLDPAETSRR